MKYQNHQTTMMQREILTSGNFPVNYLFADFFVLKRMILSFVLVQKCSIGVLKATQETTVLRIVFELEKATYTIMKAPFFPIFQTYF